MTAFVKNNVSGTLFASSRRFLLVSFGSGAETGSDTFSLHNEDTYVYRGDRVGRRPNAGHVFCAPRTLAFPAPIGYGRVEELLHSTRSKCLPASQILRDIFAICEQWYRLYLISTDISGIANS